MYIQDVCYGAANINRTVGVWDNDRRKYKASEKEARTHEARPMYIVSKFIIHLPQ